MPLNLTYKLLKRFFFKLFRFKKMNSNIEISISVDSRRLAINNQNVSSQAIDYQAGYASKDVSNLETFSNT